MGLFGKGGLGGIFDGGNGMILFFIIVFLLLFDGFGGYEDPK